MGCDKPTGKAKYQLPMFQSTHPHGVRRVYPNSTLQNPRVSIHAPTWGATDFASQVLAHFGVFQSTHPHGVRQRKVVSCQSSKMFQSTHPHGVRPWQYLTLVDDFEFQSTHPHGVRLKNSLIDGSPLGVSIHAPTWGATTFRFAEKYAKGRFNPRTHMGCDFEMVPKCYHKQVSIHAPTWGATLIRWTFLLSLVFQSTHPHGVRPTEVKRRT